MIWKQVCFQAAIVCSPVSARRGLGVLRVETVGSSSHCRSHANSLDGPVFRTGTIWPGGSIRWKRPIGSGIPLFCPRGFPVADRNARDLVFKEVLFAADKGTKLPGGDSPACDAGAMVPDAQENAGLALP